MMLLSGCSTTRTNTLYLTPPAIYTLPCERSSFTGQTYGDVVVFLRMVMKERDMCANRIDKVREWIIENAQR